MEQSGLLKHGSGSAKKPGSILIRYTVKKGIMVEILSAPELVLKVLEQFDEEPIIGGEVHGEDGNLMLGEGGEQPLLAPERSTRTGFHLHY